MGRSLVIVESPAKAKTINKYLGRNYTVKASYGHIMDLPKKELGIDIAHGFAPTYEVNPDKTNVVTQLQKAASTADYGEGVAGDLYVHLLSGIQCVSGINASPKRFASS